ncbi:MAG: hypothetical protein JST54_20610 [Deltaproteobacteria bacterium]|nr:hypothetical protein [Deltaproteobacteria bacterium]
MKESVARFERRTGMRYDPTRTLRALGKPLAARTSCPTLFRFPSPDALQALLQNSLTRLAPADRAVVWLAADVAATERPNAARNFGLAVVLRPLELQVVQAGPSAFLGTNAALGPDDVCWAPPSSLQRKLAWDKLAHVDDVNAALGPKHHDERSRVHDALGAYLEELAQLDHAGVPAPPKPWSELSPKKRLAQLADAGIRGRWTRAR